MLGRYTIHLSDYSWDLRTRDCQICRSRRHFNQYIGWRHAKAFHLPASLFYTTRLRTLNLLSYANFFRQLHSSFSLYSNNVRVTRIFLSSYKKNYKKKLFPLRGFFFFQKTCARVYARIYQFFFFPFFYSWYSRYLDSLFGGERYGFSSCHTSVASRVFSPRGGRICRVIASRNDILHHQRLSSRKKKKEDLFYSRPLVDPRHSWVNCHLRHRRRRRRRRRWRRRRRRRHHRYEDRSTVAYPRGTEYLECSPVSPNPRMRSTTWTYFAGHLSSRCYHSRWSRSSSSPARRPPRFLPTRSWWGCDSQRRGT